MIEINNSWGFSCPATNVTFKLSWSCLSSMRPSFRAASNLLPNLFEVIEGDLPSWLLVKVRSSSREKLITSSLAFTLLGIGKRSRKGKFMNIGWKIWRFTADWSVLSFALGFLRVYKGSISISWRGCKCKVLYLLRNLFGGDTEKHSR